jgi:hypothetical protein
MFNAEKVVAGWLGTAKTNGSLRVESQIPCSIAAYLDEITKDLARLDRLYGDVLTARNSVLTSQ